MATKTEESNPPVTIEERYGTATSASNLRLDENRPGAVNLLIAAGVAARGDLKASRVLGGALQRLITEWDRIEKPKRMRVMSMKEWIEALPLIEIGQRRDKGGKLVAIMSRDREGARSRRAAQQKESDEAFDKALISLADKLPSRVVVRESLYQLAMRWGCEEPDDLVAAAIVYWLASKCQVCSGTGIVQAGDKIRTCDKCHGGTDGPVPGADAGHRLLAYMDLCRVTWLGAFKQAYRDIHKG